MLLAEVDRRLGSFRLEVGIEVRPGATLALVGESGSGKTTLLRLLAGLQRPDRGRIVVDEVAYFDDRAGVNLPPRERQIGYVAQDYSLFPHLTVAQNVAFGLRASGHAQSSTRTRVAAVLDQLGIAWLARRRPGELSGGQQQRVALARALVLEPRLLLLDEPLSALDLQTRRTVRGELRRLLSRLPCLTIYVTHSPTEAVFFGDGIAVLESGRVGQYGSPDELLRRPRSAYVAELMGVNLIRGEVRERLPGGLARVATAGGHLLVPDPGGEGEIFVVVDPREIVLSLEPSAGSARNKLEGRIEELNFEPPLGERVRVALATRPPLVAEVTRQSVESLGLRPGLSIHAAFKATGVTAFR